MDMKFLDFGVDLGLEVLSLDLAGVQALMESLKTESKKLRLWTKYRLWL